MSGILNIGTRALLANQAALQVAGNNIANVNTEGYARQRAVMETARPMQVLGGRGMLGSGVEIQQIQIDMLNDIMQKMKK